MKNIKNDRYLRVLRGEKVDRTPAWIMRQAGRYLPEYRKTRAQAGDFMDLCRNTELACEVTMQPLRRFKLDAAILFSDILTIPDALGLDLSFVAGEGPVFSKPITDLKQIESLRQLDVEEDLGYVVDAVKAISSALDASMPLIGFSGSPWTLATYMVEGGSSKQFAKVKQLAYRHPEAMRQLLDNLSDNVTRYLLAQVKAGADALMIFDTWGGVLTPSHYQHLSVYSMEKIIRSLKSNEITKDIPITVFSKGIGEAQFSLLKALPCEGVGVDWTHSLSGIRTIIGDDKALQGNLDPCALYADQTVIRESVDQVLSAAGKSRHIFNLGHGVHPDMPPGNVEFLLTYLQEASAKYHKA